MRLGILGKKVGMTQIFGDTGSVVPVTVIDTSGCFISQVKTKTNDGYNAIQLSVGDTKPQNVNKARTGHFKKAGVTSRQHIKEMRVCEKEDMTAVKAGQRILASTFQKGDVIDVIAHSKGKGFQGVMKRHGFHGADATHGVHEYFRHGGSAGSNTFPGRILKNKGMPGRTGNTKITVQNLEVVDVRPEENLLLLKGAVPGPRTGLVFVRTAIKGKKAATERNIATA